MQLISCLEGKRDSKEVTWLWVPIELEAKTGIWALHWASVSGCLLGQGRPCAEPEDKCTHTHRRDHVLFSVSRWRLELRINPLSGELLARSPAFDHARSRASCSPPVLPTLRDFFKLAASAFALLCTSLVTRSSPGQVSSQERSLEGTKSTKQGLSRGKWSLGESMFKSKECDAAFTPLAYQCLSPFCWRLDRKWAPSKTRHLKGNHVNMFVSSSFCSPFPGSMILVFILSGSLRLQLFRGSKFAGSPLSQEDEACKKWPRSFYILTSFFGLSVRFVVCKFACLQVCQFAGVSVVSLLICWFVTVCQVVSLSIYWFVSCLVC